MEALAARKTAIEGMLETMKAQQADLRKATAGLQQLQSQLQENVLVREELSRVGDDRKVYKLVGPVLIPQEADEARSTVGTRIGFIDGEVKKAEGRVRGLETKAQEVQQGILKAQQELQMAVQEAAKKDPTMFASAAGGQ